MAEDQLMENRSNKPLTQRIGRYKLICRRGRDGRYTRVLGPDFWIMSIAVFTLIFPMLILLIVVIPSYESLAALIVLEVVSVIILVINLISFYSLSTSDPGIIPRTDSRVIDSQGYYIRIDESENLSNESTELKLKF
jgi:hypothetical protein